MKEKDTKEIYLRDLDLQDYTQGMEVDSGSVYHKLFGTYPDTYFSHANYDFDQIRKYFINDLKIDDRNIILSKVCFKKEEERITLLVAKLPYDTVFLYELNSHSGESTAFCHVTDEGMKFRDEVLEKLESMVKKKPENSLYMLSKEYDGFGFKPFSLDGKKIELDLEKHYNDDFIEINARIQDALKEKEQGLVLLHGKPGTGKTTYLKQLLKTTDRDVIYIPTEMVSGIASPGLVDVLFRKKGAVLFIEDAEEALLERGKGGSNAAAVSTLLNITDGFLADVLQLTVFCTFNSRYDQIDRALTRKGRILAKYEFKDLVPEKVAAIVGEKLHEEDFGKAMTIAEAFNYESPSYNMQALKIGF